MASISGINRLQELVIGSELTADSNNFCKNETYISSCEYMHLETNFCVAVLDIRFIWKSSSAYHT